MNKTLLKRYYTQPSYNLVDYKTLNVFKYQALLIINSVFNNKELGAALSFAATNLPDFPQELNFDFFQVRVGNEYCLEQEQDGGNALRSGRHQRA